MINKLGKGRQHIMFCLFRCVYTLLTDTNNKELAMAYLGLHDDFLCPKH